MLPTKKSQSIFEFAVAIIAIAGLVVGIVRIWIWFNANYAKRQYSYQGTRLSAVGNVRPADYTNYQPIGYTPLELTKDWVFKGLPSGTVSGADPGGLGTMTSEQLCDLQCKDSCSGDPGCGSAEVFNISCDCYKQCQAQCLCDNHIKPTLTIYQNQATTLTNNAVQMHQSANSMRDAADDCDDPWELCWWGNWGKSAKELRNGARELDRSARGLERAAARLENRRTELARCCNEEMLMQAQCLEKAKANSECSGDCAERSEEYINTCQSRCSGWMMDFCYLTCETQGSSVYNSCYQPCVASNAPTCNESISGIMSSIDDQIASYNETIAEDQALYDQISSTVTTCNNNARAECEVSCRAMCISYDGQGNPVLDQQCYAACYDGCYETKRDECCRAGCCQGASGGWGRNCDTPSDNCDAACEGQPSCLRCGLSKTASTVSMEIQDLQVEISRLTRMRTELPSCCQLPTVDQQNACITDKVNVEND